ncbi:primosomal protein N' [Nocardia inohanensis]|uniref:primosomal protein N' n=1 Tax=Nocardia inohanensis TaxID=209246 RepID=UPI001C3F8F85|nr:primosomal protein N' [Nocardia inohanensis]
MSRPIARVLPLLEPAHLDRDFDYLVPPEMDELAQPGVRVRVRFSGRLVDGYILERLEKSPHTGKLVRLDRVVSGERVLTPEILRLVTAVAARYAGTRADVLRLAIPPRHAKVETEGIEKPPKPAKPSRASKKRAAASATTESLEPTAADSPVGAASSAVTAETEPTRNSSPDTAATGDMSTAEPAAVDDIAAPLDVPEAVSTAVEGRDTDQVESGGMADTHAAGDSGEFNLSGTEAAAGQSIPEMFPGWGRYAHGHSFLGALAAGRGPRAGWQALPGEDWARRLAEMAAVTVRGGRSVVITVPDQRDLDRVLAECVALVGESAVGLSAGLGPSARYRRWLSVLRGAARVVVGTRSAVFAPARDLGLIIIWDDGDDTFAEPRSPYPHAREVAMLRAHETGAAFVAGGFARTAEVQAIVESGWAHDLVADRAELRAATPRITAPGESDTALERDPIAKAIRIPGAAFLAARQALNEGLPVLVQVPRRGYVPALACAKCRTPARCRHCNGPLALPENGSRAGGAPVTGSRADLGVTASLRRGEDIAHSPQCRWCGITEAAFRCGHCGSRALRAVVIGAARTAEELGRAFPGVPVRGSGGSSILDTVPAGPQVVVATIGAEPRVPGGYSVAMLLDGWALLGRADLRAAEDALRRWMSAAALVRAKGRVFVMADAGLATVQALVRWDPVGHARFELEGRTEVRFPPAVRFAAVDGTTESIAELLGETKLPGNVEVLGPVPLPPGARKPFSSGDSPAEVERMILRVDKAEGAALSRALTAAQAVRSTHRSDAPLRVQIDPIDIG